MANETVSPEAFIIRRIPPSNEIDTVAKLDDGSLRPTSATLSLRAGEAGLSCSQAAITSPEQLLKQIGKTGADGWMVAKWLVSDVPKELEVVVTPSDPPALDPGHCEIRRIDGLKISKKQSSQLAKAGRILSDSQTP